MFITTHTYEEYDKNCYYEDPNKCLYEIGERVAQLVILKLPEVSFKEVDQLSETNRGSKGFGSSDLKI